MTHDERHDEHHEERRSVQKLGLVAALNLVGFVVELVGGLVFGSVALLGDAFHMLFDAVAYLLALGAAVVAARVAPSDQWSYGLHRIEPFAAFLNGALLVPMVGVLLFESYRRYLSPIEIDTRATILLAGGGLLINVASVYVLQGGEMSLNERGAYYHLIGDTGASIAVIGSMVVIELTGVRFVDPLAAVLIAGLIVWSAVVLLRESVAIFFQKSPVSRADVRDTLEAIDGVERVEDVHLWYLTDRLRIATVYLVDSVDSLEARDRLVERIHDVLEAEFDVSHATIEAAGDAHTHGSKLHDESE